MARVTKEKASLLPNDRQAEEAVLGSLLIDPDAVWKIGDLRPEDFFVESYGALFATVTAARYAGEPADLVTLASSLPEGMHSADVTGLIGATPSSIHAAHYAKIVQDMARRRQLMAVATDIVQRAHDCTEPVGALFDEASAMLREVGTGRQDGAHLYGSDESLTEYLALLVRRSERSEDDVLTTGLPDLDRLLGELLPGALQIVAARSSVGKTMYLEQLSEFNARKGHPVAFYHLEQSHEAMQDRRMARWSGITFQRLRRGYDGPEVAQAIDKMREWHRNVIYVHCPGWSAERIAADMTELHSRGECDLAVVDYLQKITLPDRKGMVMAMLYGMACESLKTAAERLGIPVILGSQVSREYKRRRGGRPRLSDLRNSGEPEEKANQAIILHRPNETRGQPTEPIVAFVEKNTNGPLGAVTLVHVIGQFLLACPTKEEEGEKELKWYQK